MPDIGALTLRRVAWRLLPFLGLCYVVAWLDRVNIGMAALTMNRAVGLSATAFGAGAGIFFLGYFLCEVPSNLMLRRVGARRWIARIMASWGLVTMAMAAVKGETSFLVLRFLLGAAEAGFFPGMLYYLTTWFPVSHRGRMIGIFMACSAAAGIVGPPISAGLMRFDGVLGLAGWQWLFLTEGAAAVVCGGACLFLLVERPETARFLAPAERDWLRTALAADVVVTEARGGGSVAATLADPRVWLLSAIGFGLALGTYSLNFWVPLILQSVAPDGIGSSPTSIGFVSAGTSVTAAAAMVLWPRHSDRTGERLWHLVLPIGIACLGFAALSQCLAHPGAVPVPVVILALAVATAGIAAAVPVFWTWPATFLSGAGAAMGLAFINSIGNLAGYFGPQIVGILKDRTGGFDAALLPVAAGLAVAGGLAVALGRVRRLAE